jgi:hypothetical protein
MSRLSWWQTIDYERYLNIWRSVYIRKFLHYGRLLLDCKI